MPQIKRSDPLVTICSIFLLIRSLIWNIYKVEKNRRKVQLGHSNMNCEEDFSVHTGQGIIQSHLHLSRRQWSHSELLKIRPRFTMLGLEASTCAYIKKIGIKRRFRGYHSRRKPNRQPMREKDQKQGIHHQFLREPNNVFLPKGKTTQQYIKIGIANVTSVRRKTEEILHHVIEENLDLTPLSKTCKDNDDNMTKAKLKTEKLKYIGNKERSYKGRGVGIIYKPLLQ